MPEKLTQSLVERWVSLMSGVFSLRDLRQEYGIEEDENKAYLRVVMGRLAEQGIVVPLGKDGTYRKIDSERKPMDWQGADPKKTIPLKFPFGLGALFKIYRKSIVIVAGSKQVGKTAFLYNFIKLNMHNTLGVDLYNSETGAEQMKERFMPFDIPEPAPFNVYEQYDNFADVIDPDRISVIDYLDLNSEVYLVGEEIDRIFRKTNCVAVIGIQKPPPTVTYVKGVKKIIDRDLGYGGGFSAKRAVVYISMSSNKLKLVYVKTPASPKINPNNMQWTFRIGDDGVSFEDIQEYQGEDEFRF